MSKKEQVRILLIEDNPGDVRLTLEAFKESKLAVEFHSAMDGEEALEMLFGDPASEKHCRPDLILLDLNLPKKSGIEVLDEIKKSAETKVIPVIVLTTSDAEHDVQKCYELQANAYILKPVDFLEYTQIIKLIDDFWFNLVKLPER